MALSFRKSCKRKNKKNVILSSENDNGNVGAKKGIRKIKKKSEKE